VNPDPRLQDAVHRTVAGVMAALGSVCVAAGAAIALYAGWVVYLLIEEPKRVAIVSYLLDLSSKSLQAARGSIDGKAFEIELGEPVFWFLFLLAGVFLLGIVTGVAKALVSTGISLIQPALAELRRPNPPA